MPDVKFPAPRRLEKTVIHTNDDGLVMIAVCDTRLEPLAVHYSWSVDGKMPDSLHFKRAATSPGRVKDIFGDGGHQKIKDDALAANDVHGLTVEALEAILKHRKKLEAEHGA